MEDINIKPREEVKQDIDDLVLGVSELICKLLEQHSKDSGEESLEVVRFTERKRNILHLYLR